MIMYAGDNDDDDDEDETDVNESELNADGNVDKLRLISLLDHWQMFGVNHNYGATFHGE